MFGTGLSNPLFTYFPSPLEASVGLWVAFAAVLAAIVLAVRNYSASRKLVRHTLIFSVAMSFAATGLSRAITRASVDGERAYVFLPIIVLALGCTVVAFRWTVRAGRNRRLLSTGGLAVALVATLLVAVKACQVFLAPGGGVWRFLNGATLQLANMLCVALYAYVLLIIALFVGRWVRHRLAVRAARKQAAATTA